MAICTKCKARIEWARTRAGRWMPLDPPVVRGEACKTGGVVVLTQAGDVVRIEVRAGGSLAGRVSHFATCPNAGDFRQRR